MRYYNFILFKIYVETWKRWASFSFKRDKFEFIVDFGWWTIYLRIK